MRGSERNCIDEKGKGIEARSNVLKGKGKERTGVDMETIRRRMQMFKESIIFDPEYEWNNLTEEQFKAMRNHIFENYPERRDGGIDCNIRCRGGELRRGWNFVLSLNWVKYDNRCRTSSNLADTYIFLKEAIKEMRKVAWELEDIRVAME